MPAETTRVYEFGVFRVDVQKRLLTSGNSAIPLTPKAFETLLLLIDQAGQVVRKKDLMASLWPDSFVEEGNLTQNIFILRKALGETAHDHQFILTVPGSGYRFAADVKKIERQSDTAHGGDPAGDYISELSGFHSIPRPLVRAVVMALIIGLGFWVVGKKFDRMPFSQLNSRTMASAASISPRRSIAVLGFRNLTNRPQDAWLSTALAEMFNTEFAAGQKLRVISGEEVARGRSEMGKADESFPPQRGFPNFGSDLLVSGSYAVIGEGKDQQIRIGVRIQDAKSGEVLDDVAETGPDSNLFELVSRTGARLRDRLGVDAVSPSEALIIRASLPTRRPAAQLYAEGLGKLRLFEALGAQQLLSRATLLEPSFPLAHSALSTAWAALGYDGKASAEAKKAYDLSTHLSREDRLRVEASYWLSRREWDKAVEVNRSLVMLHPDDLDDGLRLASALTAASRGHQALDVLESLRRLSAPLGNDPRIDLQAALSWTTLGDLGKMPPLLISAADKANARGATLILAQARNQQCWLLPFLAQQQSNFDVCTEALNIYTKAGNQRNLADTWRVFGAALAPSDPVRANQMYQESLKIQHTIGNVAGEALVVNELAIQAAMHNDHATAASEFQHARDLFVKVDHKVAAAGLLINIGGELVCQGKSEKAIKLFERARDAGRQLDNKELEGFALYNIGTVQQDRGNLQVAKQLISTAMDLFKQVNDRSEVASTQFALGEIATAAGDFNLARKLGAEALQVRRAAGDKLATAESEFDIADLSFKEGRTLPETEQTVRHTIEIFRESKSSNNEAKAEALLAQLLVSQKRPEEAIQDLHFAEAASLRSDLYYQLASAISIARSRSAISGEDERRQATADLNIAIAKARRYGYLGLVLEGRLGLGEIQLAAGRYDAARTTLAGVATNARACGLILLSNQASEKLAHVSRNRS